MNKIKIAMINGGLMDLGGISAFMMNFYRNIDKNIFQFDFIVHGNEEGYYDKEIINLGGRIIRVPHRNESFILNYKTLKHIFSEGSYDIVHSNLDAMNYLILKIAKECRIPIRISHSHNTKHLTNNIVKKIIYDFLKFRIKYQATHLLACSNNAAKWLYGKKVKNYSVIFNAIETEKFLFNKCIRDDIREMYDLDDKIVMGNVGRFDYQKNHLFLIDVFNNITKFNEKAFLILIGDGHLRHKITKKISRYGLSDKVLLLGYISNPQDFYNAMDLFIMPSIFEGLGIAAVEAQLNGLPCFLSDGFPTEVCISNRVNIMKLRLGPKRWASIINSLNSYNRLDVSFSIDYDIKSQAKKLCQMYIEMVGFQK